MPKRSRAEMIAAKEAELAALRASEDKSKVSRVTKLKAEIVALDERIDKLELSKNGKLDEITLLEREIAEDRLTAETDANVAISVGA